MNEDKLKSLRHSMAHITAAAVKRLWPSAKFGVGPVVENGYYYDIDLGSEKISEEDFSKIEAEIKNIIKEAQPFERLEMPIDKAIEWARLNDQPYKLELLNDLKRAGTTVAKDIATDELGLEADGDSKIDKVSFYKNGDFLDLCKGPHLENTGQVKAFKLIRVAGAYWRGKETNPQMQRLYGVAFDTKDDLDNYLKMIEEAKRRDHRKIGQELGLYVFSDLVGTGLPLFTPAGTTIMRQLDNYVQEMREEYGYQEVRIPHLTKKEAYIASGHWNKFEHELFKVTTREGHEFAMKPMNCPHHTQIYASSVRSYRDLPIRYRETTVCYRDEQTGELSGLSRLRAFTQDDAHVFCRSSQIEEETLKIWDMVDRFYSGFGFKLRVRLSTHDPSNMGSYSGAPEAWATAEDQLKKIVEEKIGSDYLLGQGEAAFYGPKIDFLAKDAIGREHQVATIQLDFNQPEGFNLVCINEDGEQERVTMIHAAIMGSIERFLSVYLEHTAGRLPLWLAPEQLRIISVNQEGPVLELAEKIYNQAKENGLRIKLDASNQSVGKKIREAELMKIPYAIVIGEKEVTSQKITPRIRKDLSAGQVHEEVTIDSFLLSLSHESTSRASVSSM